MLKSILPNEIIIALENISLNKINEIRMRNNKPIQINFNGRNYFLTNNGLSEDYSNAIVCKLGYINYVINKVSSNSLYTINDDLIKGFVTCDNGIRIGIAGDIVKENGKVKTIKNLSSINIRIPHEIKNCSLNAYQFIVKENNINSTLILSKPGAGKTTFIKDLIYQLGKRMPYINLLVVDERGEISAVNEFYNYVGNADIYKNCSKEFGFENGIRSLKPDVIITDEINFDNDINIIKNALTCGVKVIATIHANNINDLRNKSNFVDVLRLKMFQRFIVLNSSCGPGTLEGVYNENLSCIYC